MRSEVVRRWATLAAPLLLACGEAVAACPVYELRVADGLKKSQSLSVRLFGYRQPVHYDDEPMPELQRYLAEELVGAVRKVQRFTGIAVIAELEPARTDLVLEGVLTEVDEGKLAPLFGPESDRGNKPARIHVRGAIKHAASGEEVLVFDCGRGKLPTRLPPVSGKTLVRSTVKDIAEDISRVIVASEREPVRYHFEEERLVAKTRSAWQSVSVAWRPDGRFVAAAGSEGLIRIWNAQTRNLEAETSRHSGAVLSVAWSPDGKRLASAGQDKTVRIWEWFEGEPITQLTVFRGHAGDVLSLEWSPDGQRLASAGKDQAVRLWEADSQGRGALLAGHQGAVRSVAWSPDGARLASCSEDGTVRIWDAASGKEQMVLRGHEGKVWDIAWSPDGKRLASSGEDRVLRVRAAATGREERVLKVDTHVLGGVSWSQDGSRLLTVERNLVRLWDAASGNEIRTVLMYPCPDKQRIIGPITREVACMGQASLSPDGTRLAVAGHVTLVRWLYDAAPP